MIIIEKRTNKAMKNYNTIDSFMDLDNYKISTDLMKIVNKSIAYKHCIFPYKENERELFVAMNNPLDSVALNDLRFISQKNIIPSKASKRQILSYIKLFYEIKDSKKAIEEIEENAEKKVLNENNNHDKEIKDSPSVRLIDSIINQAIGKKASDIHIEPFNDHLNVRIRVDGVLQKHMKLPKSTYKSICIRIKIMSKMNITLRMIPQDGKIDYVINDIGYDFRVSSIPTIHGEKFVIRVLYKTTKNISLDELTYSNASIIRNIISRPNGIILLCGPTGSGKSSTVYSILKELNTTEKNIVTIEDPVEFTIDNINQINVNKKAGLTFPVGLRSLLRQDPDIISIGEIRDEETAKVAVRAAITGHLVISTLHTNDAPSTVLRLMDMGIKHYLLADALVAVIAQRLVRKICPYCKEKYIPSSAEKKLCGLKEEYLYKGKGCSKCNDTGYIGRMAIFEIMKVDDTIKNFIYEEKSTEDLRACSIKNGMMTLRENSLELIKKGITTVDEYKNIVYTNEDCSNAVI
ncbi:GspE/PulE family protein [Clostridium arbusti]|uniref:GspE/PulE family protein n=1 Tax=Clostridium arbusti TaxID=1137848 RepID=UPI000288E832|nr:GspE/PulE family protein [Clostridium arbusti]